MHGKLLPITYYLRKNDERIAICCTSERELLLESSYLLLTGLATGASNATVANKHYSGYVTFK